MRQSKPYTTNLEIEWIGNSKSRKNHIVLITLISIVMILGRPDIYFEKDP